MPISLEYAQEEFAKEVVLTPRWLEPKMKPHRMQSLLMYHPAKFKWAPAGRRSGKTEVGKRKVVTKLIQAVNSAAPKIIIGAPNYTRCKDIYFDDLVSLIPGTWIKKIKESTRELQIRTHWNAEIRMVGMDNPKVVEGPPWSFGLFDELADYPKNCFENNISLAFATEGLDTEAMMIGVPDEDGKNQSEYEKYYELGLLWGKKGGNKDHCSFYWPSTDILSKETVESMAETMDADRYKQEVLGLFVKRGNKVAPDFNVSIHVDADYAEYCPFIPICHTLDFGVRPTASLIGQHYGSQIWILDEILLGDGSTDVAGNAFIERCGESSYDMFNGLEVYGDAAGRTPGQNIGISDYRILRKIYEPFHPIFKNNIANPEIKDTVNALRLRLKNYKGVATLFIHPRCKNLIEELKSAPWPDKLDKFHCLAALRYFVYKLSEFARTGGIVGTGRVELTEDQQLDAKFTRRR